VSWVFSQSARFASDYVRFGPAFAKLAPDKVRVLLHATVKNILTSEDASQVVALEIVTTEGEVHLVRSRQFVLCCGGIENARLLLAARDVNPRGLGNEHGLVGRFLMDHPRATLGTFASADMHAVQGYLGLFSVPSKARFQCGLRLSDEVQRDERLLNAAAWTTQHVAEDDVWRSLRSALIARGPDRLAKIGAVCRNGSQLVTSLWDKFARGRPIRRKFSHLDLDCMVEQEPNRESCIRLSSRKDAFGVPLAQLDWKIGDLERQTVVRLGRAVHDALAKAGLPTPTLVDWVREDRPENAVFTDAAHPAGSTRMASSPLWGVVDPNCQVFGIENLYIAGSSVFPTCGHANPTLAIVTLAVRLADRLRNLS
jgi:choline dehydrogenase-like flavoprotein